MPERYDKTAWPYRKPPRPPSSLRGPPRRSPQGQRRVGTLGDLVETGLDVWLSCVGPGTCGRSTQLVSEDLVARYGADHGVQRFLDRAVCSVCGARYPKVQLQVSTRAQKGGGHPGPVPADAWGSLEPLKS